MSFSYIYVGMLFTSCKQQWQIQHVGVVGCKDHMFTNMKWKKHNLWLSVKELQRHLAQLALPELDLKCLSDHKTPKTCHSTLVQKDRGMHRFKCHVNPGLINPLPPRRSRRSRRCSIDFSVTNPVLTLLWSVFHCAFYLDFWRYRHMKLLNLNHRSLLPNQVPLDPTFYRK